MSFYDDEKTLAAAAQAVLAASDAVTDATRLLTAATARFMLLTTGSTRGNSVDLPMRGKLSDQLKSNIRTGRIFTDEERAEICELYRNGVKQTDIAARFNTYQAMVSAICNGRSGNNTKRRHLLPSTVAGLIVAALRRSEHALDRDGILASIVALHGTGPSEDSIRRTSNELIAKGTIVRDGKFYKLLG